MKKENKLWLPLVIVLAVLIVGLFVASIIVKVTIGKHEVKKGTDEVVKIDYDVDDDDNYEAVEGDDFSYEAEITVKVVSALENPNGHLIKKSPWYYELTENDFKDMTAEELYYAYYEIYAYQGCTFDNPTVQAYFDSKSWYYGYSTYTMDYFNKWFADYPSSYTTVTNNIALLQKYVTDNNLTYTP